MTRKLTVAATRKASPVSVAELAPEPSKEARKEVASSLEEAFSFECSTRIDLEKAIRSVAFLLMWGSEMGNDSLSPQAANGLAEFLKQGADKVARIMLDREEAHDAGADPRTLYGIEKPQTAS